MPTLGEWIHLVSSGGVGVTLIILGYYFAAISI